MGCVWPAEKRLHGKSNRRYITWPNSPTAKVSATRCQAGLRTRERLWPANVFPHLLRRSDFSIRLDSHTVAGAAPGLSNSHRLPVSPANSMLGRAPDNGARVMHRPSRDNSPPLTTPRRNVVLAPLMASFERKSDEGMWYTSSARALRCKPTAAPATVGGERLPEATDFCPQATGREGGKLQ